MSSTLILEEQPDPALDRSKPQNIDTTVLPRRNKAAEDLNALIAEYTWDKVDKAIDDGHQVISAFIPYWGPLIRACGAIPAQMMVWMKGKSHDALAIAENYFHVPPEFCSVIKTQIGGIGLRSQQPGGDRIKRQVYFGGGCEPSVMATELSRSEGYDLHIIQPLTAFKMEPSRRDEYVKFYMNEVQRLALWLSGKPVDEDKLKAYLIAKNRIIRKITQILDLRVKNPLYFPMTKVSQMLLASGDFYALDNYEANRDRFEGILDSLIVELQLAANDPLPPYVPIVLVGNMFNADMTRTIDQSGGAIVGSLMAVTTLYREDVPPVQALAEYLLDMQIKGESSDQVGAVAGARKFRLEEALAKTGAKGIIISGTTGCPYSSLTRQMEYDYFIKKGIPIIAVEGTAHLDPVTEEIKMRVKAFIEMLIEA